MLFGIFLLIIVNCGAWAKPVVLIGYFDAFGKAPFNNSERVAKAIFEEMKLDADVEIKLCELNTVFDKSYSQLESCFKNLSTPPALTLGLGESTCDLKIEIMGRNWDQTKGPDNEGNERRDFIIKDGTRALGLKYPLADMYCALDKSARQIVDVSNDAGSFVCNNLAYQFTYNYPEERFGFIHVPRNDCKNLQVRSKAAIDNLKVMIKTGALSQDNSRFPTLKNDFRNLRNNADQCKSEFYKRTKGIDERGFWTLSN